VRQGETHGYDRGGLTDRGRQQAHQRGSALAAQLAPGATVGCPHARTARASEAAAVVRAATAFGRDLGEPDHLEGVRVLVHGDHTAATIRYRDLEIEAAPPAQSPPWMDRKWLHPSSDR